MFCISLSEHVSSGEIDCTVPGKSTLTFHLEGQDRQYRLVVEGDCSNDLRGLVLSFTNPKTSPVEKAFPLSDKEVVTIGEFTASRRVDLPTAPEESWEKYVHDGEEIPHSFFNSLLLEFFSASGQMFRINSSTYELKAKRVKFLPPEKTEKEIQSAYFAQLRSRIDTYLRRDQPLPSENQRTEFCWEHAFENEERLLEVSRMIRAKFIDREDFDTIEAYLLRWDNDDTPADTSACPEETWAEDVGHAEFDWSVMSPGIHPIQDRARAVAVRFAEKCPTSRALRQFVSIPELLTRAFPEAESAVRPTECVALLKRALNKFDTSLATCREDSCDCSRMILESEDVTDFREMLVDTLREVRTKAFA